MMPPGFKIKTIHAFIATEDDGTEGVIGELLPNGFFMAFVAADPSRIESLRHRAERIAKASGKDVVLAKFSIREDLETIYGRI